MLAMLQPSAAESLTELWAVLHRTLSITLHECEAHYLTAMALAEDDDLIAHLLLKKLRMARMVGDDEMDEGIVRMNSEVAFVHGGEEEHFCQLVHPSAPDMPAHGLGVTSRAGAGLIGLRSGQSVLWPGADGVLAELKVARVENCPGSGNPPGTSAL